MAIPHLSVPLQHRAAVLAMVLALHMVVAWVLIGNGQKARLPELDVSPVNVSLLAGPPPKGSPAALATQTPSVPPSAAMAPQAPPEPKPAPPVEPTPPASVATASTPAPARALATTPLAPMAGQAASAATASAGKESGTSGTPTSQASLVAGSCAKPEYPVASRRLEEEGTVTLRFRVEANGQVSQSEGQSSSGFKRLDEAARSALSRCRFSPALAQGQATASWATIRYTWRLE